MNRFETLNGVDWQLTLEEVTDEGRTEVIDGGGRREVVLEGMAKCEVERSPKISVATLIFKIENLGNELFRCK